MWAVEINIEMKNGKTVIASTDGPVRLIDVLTRHAAQGSEAPSSA
ncbi:hypothetical protein AAur_1322 [Paenarthrobacter aurescens TC1]|uniref:Uncharacterized protein n=1 Tax=Paenarthrobacter aurescens (strain TC1) TaxID=290340 RepID=A1R4E3_PAEAT|nr:hypothetical protein AAur_1322 [Paenarthrobacter aurescens TC1]